MKRSILALIILFLTAQAAFSQIKVGPYGKGIQLTSPDTSYYIHISGRMQFRFEYNRDGSEWSSKAYVRRARLKFEGYAFSPKLEYSLQLSLSDRDLGGSPKLIRDAYIKWHFAKGWQLWFGQTKLPGNRQRLFSSSKLEFVDRSAVEGTLTLDRDVGIQIHHTGKIGQVVINEYGSVGLGEGPNNIGTNQKGYDYTARLEILPFGAFSGKGDFSEGDLVREKSPKLSIGAAYNLNDHAIRSAGEHGSFMSDGAGGYVSTNITTVFVDALVKFQGLSVYGEYAASSTSDDGLVSATGTTFTTGHTYFLQGSYTLKSNFGFAARYGSSKQDDPVFSNLNPLTEYALGISKYISGHNLKLQSDISFLDYKTGNDELNFRLQLELSF